MIAATVALGFHRVFMPDYPKFVNCKLMDELTLINSPMDEGQYHGQTDVSSRVV
jgi:hypothetical protein